MTFKSVAVMGSFLVLAACGNGNQDPAKLKGGNFVTKSGDMEITLSFAPDDARVNGRALNLYNASYTASGDKIQFGEMLSTMMAGPEEEMQAEQEYFQFMSTVEKYELTDETLTLKNADGKEIVFKQVASFNETENAAEPENAENGDVEQTTETAPESALESAPESDQAAENVAE